MNTYNDNLHASVVNTLQTLELAKKNLKSNLDAASFSLYYAEGAIITASEKLDLANVKYSEQQNVSAQAITNGNIATNLSTAALQQKAYTAQSVTNAAVSASNIQIASNAIVRLAGDIGNIYSILKAADAEGELYAQGETAYALINATAYDAEKLSQAAMEASTYTAEVASDTVSDEAAATNTAIANLLAVTNADFSAIAATVTADHAALASAGAIEKVAEGTLESSNAEYFAVRSAYILNNRELNLNLTVTKKTYKSYDVNFNYYRAPFSPGLKNSTTDETAKDDSSYPVKSYSIMLVKDSKKQVFTISNAENLYQYPKQRKKVTLPKDSKSPIIQTTITINELLDSDGDPMKLGVKYAVFVFAQLEEDYKKLINTFDDYLSAPSESFVLTVDLVSPKADTFAEKENKITFEVIEPGIVQANNVEHRVMYLPDNKGLITGLLSEEGLRSIENEVVRLEIIADKYDPLIASLQAELLTLQAQIESLSTQPSTGATATEEETSSSDESSDAEEAPATEAVSATSSSSSKATLESEYSRIKHELDKANKARETAMKGLTPAKQTHPGFFFNTKIAEQVPFANYSKANPSANATEAKAGKFYAQLSDSVTDNFGDTLIPGYAYVPVVLTVAKVPAEDMIQYKSSLSDYATTKPFKYTPNTSPQPK